MKPKNMEPVSLQLGSVQATLNITRADHRNNVENNIQMCVSGNLGSDGHSVCCMRAQTPISFPPFICICPRPNLG